MWIYQNQFLINVRKTKFYLIVSIKKKIIHKHKSDHVVYCCIADVCVK